MRGATCLDSPNPKTGDNFTCNCRPGYDDPVCNSLYCTLPGQRCQNGRCEFLETNYEYQPRCTCAPGYTGLYCETNIDECAGSQGRTTLQERRQMFQRGEQLHMRLPEPDTPMTDCGHGRSKICWPGSYECVCNFGYCGYNCAMLDPCQENYRQNSGTCRCAKGGGYECECTSEYTGLNCTEREYLFSSQAIDIAVIVGPIVGCFFLIIISFFIAFFMMARKKRATRGT
ncbi:protein crumbs-like [Linepithema humile]|uniref:protein crumbs-like n=1 Tax=Linepithema humile TaxID=83485 RepID=UPI00351E09DD